MEQIIVLTLGSAFVVLPMVAVVLFAGKNEEQ